jgi:hypothetical protein
MIASHGIFNGGAGGDYWEFAGGGDFGVGDRQRTPSQQGIGRGAYSAPAIYAIARSTQPLNLPIVGDFGVAGFGARSVVA